MTRAQAVALANTVLDHLEARAGGLDLLLPPGKLGVLRAMRAGLAQRIADVIERNGRSERELRAFVRSRLFEVKDLATGSLLALGGHGRWRGRETSSAAPKRVLVVPRSKSHFRDLLLVARAAKARSDLCFSWVTFRPEHAAQLEREGEDVVLAPAYAPAAWLGGNVVRAKLVASLVRASRERPPELDATLWGAAVATVLEESLVQLPYASIAATAVLRAIDELEPCAVFAGNPNVMECAVAVAAAHARGLPSISMQHGVMTPDQHEWARAGVDCMLVWGEEARRALEATGFPSAKVHIAGAPWVDELRKTPRAPRAGDGRVLVAMSGAGHTVGMDEHLAHIDRLVAASSKLPHHTFVFRLHPKDDAALYHAAIARHPGARAEIVGARDAKSDIHGDLERANVLVTITSASALDAMLHRVPVVTLARPEGEKRAAFASARATVDVAASEELAAVLETLIDRGAPTEVRANADRYLETFFGPLDGRAAERVLEVIRRECTRPARAETS